MECRCQGKEFWSLKASDLDGSLASVAFDYIAENQRFDFPCRSDDEDARDTLDLWSKTWV